MLKKILTYPKLPIFVFHLPTIPYVAWLCLKARSLFFYTACNPITPFGGGKRTGKDEILAHVDPAFLPKSVKVAPGTPCDEILAAMGEAGLSFPVVAKPTHGLRGFGVVKLEDAQALRETLGEVEVTMLIQEWMDHPIEMGVLYARYPGEEKGFLFSLSKKELPAVTGDGRHTVAELAARHGRQRLFLDRYRAQHGDAMDRVLDEGEVFVLDFVAQQGRGMWPKDARHLINPRVEATFERVFGPIPGFFYGRADVKVRSLDDLETGEDIKILEINTTASIPIHIFDPAINVFGTYRDMLRHWRHIYRISKRNHARGIPYINLRDAYLYVKRHFQITASKS